jgi:endo-1,4-beta-xylanase
MNIDRRQAIKLIGTASLAGGVRSAFAEPVLPSLGEAAAERGLLYGAAIEADLGQAPPQYKDLLIRQCRLAAPALAWSSSPRPGIYNFGHWGKDARLASARGLRLTGSHFLWFEWIPAWFGAIPDRQGAERAVSDHISTLSSMFAGQVYSWNVVNEALNLDDGRPDGLRQDALIEKLGADYIEFGFRAARAADPSALLLYNDANFESAIPEHEARRVALLRLLEGLKRKDVPIDGVGLQCHIRLTDPFDERAYSSFLRQITDLGLKIVVTELDVIDLGAPVETAARDSAVADAYDRLLSVVLDNRATVAVVTWGLSDRYTWLTENVHLPPDKPRLRPLPFDADFRPKPAFHAIMQAFRNAPPRST